MSQGDGLACQVLTNHLRYWYTRIIITAQMGLFITTTAVISHEIRMLDFALLLTIS